uniref:Amino acid transporter transmembrane domain-containing protein n=1 Tax=Globodera rostochiensis TaxID=31243 RepID=A0A914GX39_GLORO
MASRRFQDWTNRNLFLASFESPSSYQHSPPPDSHQRAVPLSAHREEGPAEEWTPDGERYHRRAEQMRVPRDEVAEGETAVGPPGGGGYTATITTLQAAWNVTNAIQGMFIVGLPFAVKVGGWCAIFALTGVAWICYRTGLILIECLYEEFEVNDGNDQTKKVIRRKVRQSYREVAEAVRPGLGKFVLAAQLTELASTCILYIVLAGDLLQGCFPSVDRPAWMMLTTVILLATAFLDDLRLVSNLSMANAVSHLLINGIMVFYCLSQFSEWHLSSLAIVPNFRLFPTVASMQKPDEFKPMLALSHIAAAIFKALFGLIGFLTFAEFTQKEISNSLPNQGFKVLVNLVLVTKALLSYPLPYFAIVQLLSDNLFRGGVQLGGLFSSCYGTDKKLREWALALRILLILWTLWMALSVPYLVELMGLIGNITGTVLSFIWPAYFHLKLRGHKCSPEQRRFNKIVIGGGVSTCVLGIYYSWVELLHAIQQSGVEQQR